MAMAVANEFNNQICNLNTKWTLTENKSKYIIVLNDDNNSFQVGNKEISILLYFIKKKKNHCI